MTSEDTTAGKGAWAAWHDEDGLRLGVSGCLLGQEVRYDGGHKRDRFAADVLGPWVEWTPVCPELEVGMGVPRPPIRLVLGEGDGDVRLVCPSTGEDWTDRMARFARRRIRALGLSRLDGFLFKKDSPSCGMERVPVYRESGSRAHRRGVGRFAAELMRLAPGLPVEEEGRLHDARLRESFIERIFCRNRFRTFLARRPTRRRLVEFHTAHKMLLRAHDEAGYRKLGRLVAGDDEIDDRRRLALYEAEFQRCLAKRATPRKHQNVLQHALGYLKKHLDAREKREILVCIEDFRRGLLPLVVPITLLRFNIRRHGVDYLAGQLYFDPHPKELMLRNHC